MIGKMKCLCGHASCKDWWLTGIGSFVQGSGFSEAEADRIIAALNAAPAASEEEDGAVIHATCGACRRPSGCPVGKCAILLDNTPARPAAQAADDPSASPKHDEGRDLSGVDFIAALCSALVDHPLGPQSISHAAMTDAMHAALLAMKNSGEF